MARKEYFGALVFDRERGDYIPFDQDAVVLFEAATREPMESLFDRLQGRLNRASFDTFLQLCRSIDLITADGRFNGTFVAGRAVPGLMSAPLRVQLAVTNECPLHCRHCSQDTRDPFPNELSLSEIRKLIDEMADLGTCQLHLGGGEPFMRNDLLAIVGHARERGLSVSLSTTATSVSRVTVKKLAELGLKSVRVSLDGAAEKSYDYQRGVKGAYRKAMRGIKTLREVLDKTPIVLHSTLMKSNKPELLALSKLVEKLQLDSWSVDFLKPVGYAADAPNLWLSAEEGEDVTRRIGKIAESTHLPVRVAHFPFKGGRIAPVMGYHCLGANLYCYVSANGSVSPCSFTGRQFPAGNLRRKSLHEIWVQSDIFRKFRSAVAGPHACTACMKAATASVDAATWEKNAFVMNAAPTPATP